QGIAPIARNDAYAAGSIDQRIAERHAALAHDQGVKACRIGEIGAELRFDTDDSRIERNVDACKDTRVQRRFSERDTAAINAGVEPVPTEAITAEAAAPGHSIRAVILRGRSGGESGRGGEKRGEAKGKRHGRHSIKVN